MMAVWPLTKNRLEAGMSLIRHSSSVSALFVHRYYGMEMFQDDEGALYSVSFMCKALLFWIQCEAH